MTDNSRDLSIAAGGSTTEMTSTVTAASPEGPLYRAVHKGVT